MSSSYHNLFDNQSKAYAVHRPSYPQELADFLCSLVKSKELAWDVGTGNGQAALLMADHFDSIIATDSSKAQIALAKQHDRIEYRAAAAESSGLADSSCDLIIAASSVHWFNRPAFFKEAKRCLKDDGVIAVWCYSQLFTDTEIQNKIDPFYSSIKPFWPDPINLVLNKYIDLEFPFEEIQAPNFELKEYWDLERLLGFFSSWSAVQLFESSENKNPVAELEAELKKLDIQNRQFEIRIPLHVRIGRRKQKSVPA